MSLIEVIGQPVEQIVDSPVPRGRVPGPQCFLPGQRYSLTAEQIVDNPVPRLKVYTVDRVQQRFRSRSPSFPIQVKVFKIFSQSRVPQRFLQLLLDTLVNGFFALYHTGKKCEDPAHPGVGPGCAVELIHAMSLAGVGCCRQRHWVRRFLLVAETLTQWRGAAAGAGCARVPRSVSVRKLLDKFPHTFALVSFSPCSGVWVLPVEYSVLDISGDPACYLVQQWIHVLRVES